PGTRARAASIPFVMATTASRGFAPAVPAPCTMVAASGSRALAMASTIADPISGSRSTLNRSGSPRPTTRTTSAGTAARAAGKKRVDANEPCSVPRAAARAIACPSLSSTVRSAPVGGSPLKWFTTTALAAAEAMSPNWTWMSSGADEAPSIDSGGRRVRFRLTAPSVRAGRFPRFTRPGVDFTAVRSALHGAEIIGQEFVPVVSLREAQILVVPGDRRRRRGRQIQGHASALLHLRAEVAFGQDVPPWHERADDVLGAVLERAARVPRRER